MRKTVVVTSIYFLMIGFAWAQSKANDKLDDTIEVVKDIKRVKESIPSVIMEKSEGIIIIPSLVNGGLFVGGKRGKGLAMVKNSDGSWSNPIFVSLTAGTIGLQAGIQKVDLILVFMNKKSLLELGEADFTLGGDISLAAGPVGRSSTASTNLKLSAEVYSYSRSRGFFAGLTIDGAVIKLTNTLNRDFYGKKLKNTDMLQEVPVTSNARVNTLHKALEDF